MSFSYDYYHRDLLPDPEQIRKSAPIPQDDDHCQCKPCCGGSDEVTCRERITAEDLLCDRCREAPLAAAARRRDGGGWCGRCHLIPGDRAGAPTYRPRLPAELVSPDMRMQITEQQNDIWEEVNKIWAEMKPAADLNDPESYLGFMRKGWRIP